MCVCSLRTDEFSRVALGIGGDRKADRGGTDFVLGKFTRAERDAFNEVQTLTCRFPHMTYM